MTYTVRRAVTGPDLDAARRVALEVAERDLGYGYTPRWHWDLDRMVETYVDNDRQAMFVAADASGAVAATAAVRIGGPVSPPHAAWLADRYADRPTVAQLLRVATLPGHRRRGLARRLVAACLGFVRADGRFMVLCLHTNATVPGAEAFWRSLPVAEVHDAHGTIHFELPLG